MRCANETVIVRSRECDGTCIGTFNLRRGNEALQEESEEEENEEPAGLPSENGCNREKIDEHNPGEQAGDNAAHGGFGFAPKRDQQPSHPHDWNRSRRKPGQHEKIRHSHDRGKHEGREQEEQGPARGLAGAAFTACEIGDAGDVKAECGGVGEEDGPDTRSGAVKAARG